MDGRWDFLEWLGPDTSVTVLALLSEPAGIIRASAVSRSWRHFVIINGFCKNLCLRMCPELSIFGRIIEINLTPEILEVGSSTSTERNYLEREHKVFSHLSRYLVSEFFKKDCILEAISASSTDNFPDESIANTLESRDRIEMRASYWSSGGERDPSVPEMLTYRLTSKLCVVDEIKIWPFRAFFQYGHPIYSAKTVRFRMGYSKLPEHQDIPAAGSAGQGYTDKFVWTYISPEYPMLQEDSLQSFKLPRRVICTGGILQIELLGRVQKQEMDGLYYICVRHVQVMGQPLSMAFDFDVHGDKSGMVLKYNPYVNGHIFDAEGDIEHGADSPWYALSEKIRKLGAGRGWNPMILNALFGSVPVIDINDEYDSDGEA